MARLPIGPDLAVKGITAPASAVAGSSIVVSDTTANQGPEAVPATITQFYLSINSLVSADDILLGGRPVGALAAGATETGSVTLVVPAGLAPRTYFVVAVADGAGGVAESLESNNAKARSISITAAP
jgi:subtilase family serine protease